AAQLETGLVKKKTGEWRIVFDYRKVNKQMVPDLYPIPNIWALLQKAAGCRYYTCLDLNWGFWNVPLTEECRKYTAFITPFGLFEYNVIPFGIRNSPGEFQRAMDLALAEHLAKDNVLCYIDDIILYGDELESHFKLLSN